MLSTLCAYQLTMLIAVAFLCFSPGILPPSDVPPMWCSTSRWWPISSANSLSCHKCFERFTLTLTRIHMHLPHWLVCRNEIHGLSNFAVEDTGSLCRSAAVCIHSATMPQVYLNVSLEDMERSCVPQLWRDKIQQVMSLDSRWVSCSNVDLEHCSPNIKWNHAHYFNGSPKGSSNFLWIQALQAEEEEDLH